MTQYNTNLKWGIITVLNTITIGITIALFTIRHDIYTLIDAVFNLIIIMISLLIINISIYEFKSQYEKYSFHSIAIYTFFIIGFTSLNSIKISNKMGTSNLLIIIIAIFFIILLLIYLNIFSLIFQSIKNIQTQKKKKVIVEEENKDLEKEKSEEENKDLEKEKFKKCTLLLTFLLVNPLIMVVHLIYVFLVVLIWGVVSLFFKAIIIFLMICDYVIDLPRNKNKQDRDKNVNWLSEGFETLDKKSKPSFILPIFDKLYPIKLKKQGSEKGDAGIEYMYYLFLINTQVLFLTIYTIFLKIEYLVVGKLSQNKITIKYLPFWNMDYIISTIISRKDEIQEVINAKGLPRFFIGSSYVFTFLLSITFIILTFGLLIKIFKKSTIIRTKNVLEPNIVFKYTTKYMYVSNIFFAIVIAFIGAYVLNDFTIINNVNNYWGFFGKLLVIILAISFGIFPYLFVAMMYIDDELLGYSKMFDFWLITKKNTKIIVPSITLFILGIVLFYFNNPTWKFTIVSNILFLLFVSYVSTNEMWLNREEILTEVLTTKIANKIQVLSGHIIIIGYEAVGRLLTEEIIGAVDLANRFKIISSDDQKDQEVYLNGHKNSLTLLANNIVIIAREGGNINYLGEVAGVKIGYVELFTRYLEKRNDETYFWRVIIPVLIANENETPYYQRICNLGKAIIVIQTLGDIQVSQSVLLSYLELRKIKTQKLPKFILRVSRAKEKRSLEELIHSKEIEKNTDPRQISDENIVIFLGKELAGANASASIVLFLGLIHTKLNNSIGNLINEKKVNRILLPFIGTDTTIGNYIASFLSSYGFFGKNEPDIIKTNPVFFTDSEITKELINTGVLQKIDVSIPRELGLTPNGETDERLTPVYTPLVYGLKRDQRFLYENHLVSGYYVISNLNISHIYFQSLVELFNKRDKKWVFKRYFDDYKNYLIITDFTFVGKIGDISQERKLNRDKSLSKEQIIVINNRIISPKNINLYRGEEILILFPTTIFIPGDTQLKTIKILRNFLPVFKSIDLKLKENKMYQKQKTTTNSSPGTQDKADIFVLNLTRGLLDHRYTISFYVKNIFPEIQSILSSLKEERNCYPAFKEHCYTVMAKMLSFWVLNRSLARFEVKEITAIMRLLFENYVNERKYELRDYCIPNAPYPSKLVESFFLNNTSEWNKLQGDKIIKTLFINAYHCGREIHKGGNNFTSNNVFIEVFVQVIDKPQNGTDGHSSLPVHCDLALECNSSTYKTSDKKVLNTTDFLKLTKNTFYIMGCIDGEMPGTLLLFLKVITNLLLGGEIFEIKYEKPPKNFGLFYLRRCRFSSGNYLSTVWEEDVQENDQNNGSADKKYLEELKFINNFVITTFDINAMRKLLKNIEEANETMSKLRKNGFFVDPVNRICNENEGYNNFNENELKYQFNKNMTNFVGYFKKVQGESEELENIVTPCFNTEHLPIKKSKNNREMDRKCINFERTIYHLIDSLYSPLSCPIAYLRVLAKYY